MALDDYSEPPAINWRKRREDREIKRMVLSLWASRKMDTKDISSIVNVPESRVYNLIHADAS